MYKVSIIQSVFVEDLELARDLANTAKRSFRSPISNIVVSNYADIEDMETRKSVPLRDPKPSIAYKGRQDLVSQVMAFIKIINDSGKGAFDLDAERCADQTVVLPEGETNYVVDFRALAEAVETSRPDLANQDDAKKATKDIRNVVKETWGQVLASQANYISFK